MTPWEILGRGRTPDGGELVLARRGGELVIRVGGKELMSSRMHGSEEQLARSTCAGLAGAPRVLVGGLGLGYTLRAALDVLPAEAQVLVCELVPAVVEWNRGPLGPLAGHPLDDPRVTLETGDVAAVLRRPGPRWDAILLDVDNGPEALTRRANHTLYAGPGLEVARRALRRGGVLGVWSAAPHEGFGARLGRAGFDVTVEKAPARGPRGGATHVIFLARPR